MKKIVALAFVAVLVGSACGQGDSPALQSEPTLAPAPSASPAGENDHGTETFTTESFDVEVELDNFYFEPTFIKAPGGATATLELHNEGTATHTFTIDALDVDEELAPDATKEIEVELGADTRYEYYCRFHADQGMRGAFMPH